MSGPGLVVSHRQSRGGPADALAFGAWHEAEDVLVASGWPELVCLSYHAREPVTRLRRVAGWGLRAVAGRRRLLPSVGRPGAGTPAGPPAGRHVVFMGHSLWDVTLLERLRAVRRQAASVTMWLPEVWPASLRHPLLRFEALSLVDHLFVGIPESVAPLRELAPAADVHVLPVATDVERFCPPPGADAAGRGRPIGALAIGRRDTAQHEQLLAWSKQRHRLYLYDTLIPRAMAWEAHRDAVAHWYQHSHVSICNYAKHDRPEVIGTLRAIPMRLFEGLAAGTVLVGRPPDDESLEAVVGSSVVERFDDGQGGLNPVFETDPADPAVVAIRRRNMALACGGHDWGHRWAVLLTTLGQPLPEGLEQRLGCLAERAAAL